MAVKIAVLFLSALLCAVVAILVAYAFIGKQQIFIGGYWQLRAWVAAYGAASVGLIWVAVERKQ